MIGSIQFLHPEWFIALLLLAGLPVMQRRAFEWPTLFAPLILRYPLLQALRSKPFNPADHHKRGIRSLPFALMLIASITALAQPVQQSAAPPEVDSPQAVDLIILLNTSVSMVLKDSSIDGQQVDRMRKQIDVIRKLVSDFRGERIALVILGRPPALLLPLTSDKYLLDAMLSRVQSTLGGRNSDIGAALQLVSEKFPLHADSGGNEKIILLSTDAYQQLGAQPPQQVVNELARRGYQLHTLAIGSSHIPEHQLGKAHLIYQPVDLALLQQLAVIGGGRMLRANADDIQQKLLAAIDRSEQHAATRQPRPVTPLYSWPLLLALILLLWQLAGKRITFHRVAR